MHNFKGIWITNNEFYNLNPRNGWEKDVKWNTSLFHLILCDVLVFLANVDLKKLFNIKYEKSESN